ncbi:general secretion pathway protein GspB [Arsukibacterium sp.]|uniref:general secretion pathway protein GspB n=1 Tax=Arsukibacterium sp. TaxID=1977258 RepID=UPI0035622ED9
MLSILMDALKQQVAPTPPVTGTEAGNGWRNLALVLGFLLALALGFTLASWWQKANLTEPTASAALVQQVEPEIASSASIVAALVSNAPDLTVEGASAVSSEQQPGQQSEQEPFPPEQRVVSVTAPSPAAGPTISPAEPSDNVANSLVVQPEVEVSDELRQRFASAMAASEGVSRQPRAALRGSAAPAKDINELALQLQQQIPPLRFEAHVYATQSPQRWVKVNGKSLQEGQWVTADIRLKEITPQFVLLEMGNELFSMPALTDFK